MKPNDLGKTFLVEECQKIEVNEFLRRAKTKLKGVLISSELEADGFALELITSRTGLGGIRYWFKCPLCNKRVGTLFSHPLSQKLGCRGCLGLEYRNRRYKGMVENFIS